MSIESMFKGVMFNSMIAVYYRSHMPELIQTMKTYIIIYTNHCSQMTYNYTYYVLILKTKTRTVTGDCIFANVITM